MAFEKRDATLLSVYTNVNILRLMICTAVWRSLNKEAKRKKYFAIFMPILLQNKL